MRRSYLGIGVVVVLLLGALLVGGSFVSARNSMALKSNQVDEAFSEIDVNLARRADLIPNLVNSVKGYAKVETTILTNIAEARSGLLQAKTPDEKLAANDRLSVSLLPLTRLQENYPDLKSKRAVPAAGRRTGRHGKPDCRRTPPLQRGHPRLQQHHLRLPEQLVRRCQIPEEEHLLHRRPRLEGRTQS